MGNTTKPGAIQGKFTEVKILESSPSGVRVRLMDTGQDGFVPRREISWNRSIRLPLEIPTAGEKRKAVIINDRGKILRLSLKRVTDPWQDVIKNQKYRRGKIVTGEVVNVRHHAAYIQLEPGIDAVIYPREASFRGKGIEDVLWVGDKIRAQIIKYEPMQHTIELSIVRALQKTRTETTQDLLEKFESPPQSAHSAADALPMLADCWSGRVLLDAETREMKRILVVDDEKGWQDFIKEKIKERYRADVETVSNSDDALDRIERGFEYDLVIIDIQLGDEDGHDLVEEIREKGAEFPLLLVSIAPQDVAHLHKQHENVAFAMKRDDMAAIFNAIEQIRLGTSKATNPSAKVLSTEDIGRLVSSTVISEREVRDVLAWLYQRIRATHILLVRLDTLTREINIVAAYPLLSPEETMMAQDGLFYSPARQIIEEEQVIVRNNADCENDRRYKNFFPSLYFRSFVGVPIRIPGKPSSHALIVLNEKPGAFKHRASQQVEMGAHFLSLILERLTMLDTIQRYQQTYAMGTLLSDFVHESNHHLQVLEDAKSHLVTRTAKLPDWKDSQDRRSWLKDLQKIVYEIDGATQKLRVLSEAYSKQVNSEYEAVNVNELLKQTTQQLEAIQWLQVMESGGDKSRATIYPVLSKELPKAYSIRESLRQVFTNLMLNAVQMIRHQNAIWKKEFRGSGGEFQRAGMLIVQTFFNPNNPYPIEVRIVDNGPGIHWRHQQNIFSQGFSQRGGAGLGLHISQNIIHRLGGRLTLLDSILFEGSVFSVELPVFSEEENSHGDHSLA